MTPDVRKGLSLFYVSSLCLFYFLTFAVEDYEKLVADYSWYESKEDILGFFYNILSEKGDEYYELISYFEDEIDSVQGSMMLGISSVSQLTRAQYASNILVEIELLDKPFVSMKSRSNMPEDF